MEDGNIEERAIDHTTLGEALASSSTKLRGLWLANLRQKLEDSSVSMRHLSIEKR